MFQLLRNVHLALGLVFVVMVSVFVVSSLVIAYRPWLPQTPVDSARTVRLDPTSAQTPRTLARALMRQEDLKGDLRNIEEDAGSVRFRIFRPGTQVDVEWQRSSGQATLKTRRWGALQMMVQLHTNHGFWHDFMPSNLWAGFSLLASVGMLLLGASGIYLWFAHHSERLIGGVLLAVGLVYGLTTLVLTRLT